MATRCCMPPDSSQGWWSANSGSFTSSSSSRPAPAAAPVPTPCSSSGSSMFLATVRHSNRPGVLEGHAVVLVEPGLAGRLAVHQRLPAVGSVRLATRRSSVLLPQPDGPISETNSPGLRRRGRCRRGRRPGRRGRGLKTLPTPATATADGSASSRHRLAFRPVAHDARSISADQAGHGQPEDGGAEHGRVDLRPGRRWPRGSTR